MPETPRDSSSTTTPDAPAPADPTTDVVVQIASDGHYMDDWVWAAELARATHASLRLLSNLPPMPDLRDRRRIESRMSARHLANARLTAALLAVRRRYPTVHVTSQLGTVGAALVRVARPAS